MLLTISVQIAEEKDGGPHSVMSAKEKILFFSLYTIFKLMFEDLLLKHSSQ